MLWVLIYGELTKIILQLSSNTLLICSSGSLQYFFIFSIFQVFTLHKKKQKCQNGEIKKDMLQYNFFRVPRVWFPQIYNRALYSEILDQWFSIPVTMRAMYLIDDAYGLDSYILGVTLYFL